MFWLDICPVEKSPKDIDTPPSQDDLLRKIINQTCKGVNPTQVFINAMKNCAAFESEFIECVGKFWQHKLLMKIRM